MKKQQVIMIFFLSLMLISFLSSLNSIDGLRSAPQYFADDDSFIVIYREGKDGGDIFIPADEQRILVDSFRIYVYWSGGDNEERHIILDVYKQTEQTVTTIDENNNTITKKEIVYKELRYTKDIKVKKGMNPSGDPHYVDIEVNLEYTNVTEKIVLSYRNLKIEFFHLTHPAAQIVTNTKGDLNTLALKYLIIGLLYAGIAYLIGEFMERKALYIEFPSLLTIAVFIGLFAWILLLVLFMLSPGDYEVLLMNLVDLEPALILIPIIPILAFWFGHRISTKNLKKAAIDIHEVDVLHDKTIGGVPQIYYVEKNGKKYKIKKNEVGAFKETLLRLFLGHFEELKEIEKCSKPDIVKKYTKHDPDVIYYAEDLEFKKGGITIEKNMGYRPLILLIIAIVGIVIYNLLPSFNIELTTSQSVSILTMLIFSGVLGVIIWIWDSKVLYKSPYINIKPATVSKGFLYAKNRILQKLSNQLSYLFELYNRSEAESAKESIDYARRMIVAFDNAYKGKYDVDLKKELEQLEEESSEIEKKVKLGKLKVDWELIPKIQSGDGEKA